MFSSFGFVVVTSLQVNVRLRLEEDRDEGLLLNSNSSSF